MVLRAAVYLASLAVGALAGGAWWAAGAGPDVVGVATVLYAGVGVAVGLHFEDRLGATLRRWASADARRGLGVFLGASVAGWSLQVGLGALAGLTFGGDPRVEALALWQVPLVVWLLPVVEEWVFRGLVWDALAARRGEVVALAGSSVAFALAHLPEMALAFGWGGSLAAALGLYVLAGLGFGAVRGAWGLRAACVCHATFNAVACAPALWG